ncbi:MAG: hypothetical protein KJ709_08870 [Nanoarchaeota archaeon]|nr:hypothetical protein [Nanoarchaeota archaeon]
MKSLVFDSGPVITLAVNNLLWLLPELKKQFNGSFIITRSVKQELVDRPLKIRRFEFEALQVLKEINSGTLEMTQQGELEDKTSRLLELSNRIFSAKGHPLNILHGAEMESIAAALTYGSEAVVIDERTARLILEDPNGLHHILQSKLHTKVRIDKDALREFEESVRGLKVFRSLELVSIAYEMGLLDIYIAEELPDKTLLEALVWALRLNGCSIPQQDIQDVKRLVGVRR